MDNKTDKAMGLKADTERMMADKKIRLFAGQATVVSLSFAQSARIIRSGIIMTKERTPVALNIELAPGDLQNEFLCALDQKNLKYHIISRDDTALFFAVGRDRREEVEQAIDNFSFGARGLALTETSVLQYFNATSLKDRIFNLFDSERREVSKVLERLNRG